LNFAVMGGDERQTRLAALLAADGHRVAAFALGLPDDRRSAGEAAEDAGVLVLPLPASDGAGALNAPRCGDAVRVEDVFRGARGKTALAGRAGADVKEAAEKAGVRLIDYFDREELAVRNAAITAEGAVQLLMESLPVTLLGAKVLVVGFGRIGKALSLRLRAMGAAVTVSARRGSDFAWIEVFGCGRADTRTLGPGLGDFDAVVNTVPAPVLSEDRLRLLRPGCLVVDLASRPGGTDFAAAKRLGLRAFPALSLPGKMSPESAAAAIRDTIYNILTELECSG